MLPRALALALALGLHLCQPTVPQSAPTMQPIPPSGSTRRPRVDPRDPWHGAVLHDHYLRQQAEAAETAARYKAALRQNSRGAREAARLAAVRAKKERPVSVVATLAEESLLAAWALALPDEGEEAVLALSAVRVGAQSARTDQHALPSDVRWLVATGLGAEHTYTIEVNGEEILTQQSNDTLAAGVALSSVAHDEPSKISKSGSEWAEGKVGDQTYYYRIAEPEKIFWGKPDDVTLAGLGKEEL